MSLLDLFRERSKGDPPFADKQICCPVCLGYRCVLPEGVKRKVSRYHCHDCSIDFDVRPTRDRESA